MDDEAEVEQDLPVRNLVLSVCDLRQHGDTPVARCGSQAAMLSASMQGGRRMYLHGGCDENQAYGDLHLLEVEQMRWTLLQTTGVESKPRWGHSVEAHGANIVLFGGLVAGGGGGGSLLGDGEAGGSAAGMPNPPFAGTLRWAHRGTPDNALMQLDTQSLVWSAPASSGVAPSPRFCHSACVSGNTYLVFGGCGAADYSQPLGDLHLLDLTSNSWTSPTTTGQAPTARYGHKMMATADNKVFVFGGLEAATGENANPGTLYCYDLAASTWSVVQVAGTAPLERSFHTMDCIDKYGFVFAGSTPNTTSSLYILDVPNMRWSRPLYEGTVSVRGHATAVLQDHLVVFGGVRDKTKGESVETRLSKKLFFLNVLEVKSGAAEGEYKFKLVTVGDSGVGKSCLLTRFVSDFYSDFHVSTIGVDFKTVVTMVKGRLVKLQLWDTAGQERFSVVTGNYYRNSDGFVFVYDATRRTSFEHIDQWMDQVKQHHECGPGTVKVLVGNKSDMGAEVVVSEEEGRAKAESMGAIFIATSAKTAANVDMAFLSAAQNLVETRRQQKQQPVPASSMGSGNVVPGRPQRGGDKAKCGCGV